MHKFYLWPEVHEFPGAEVNSNSELYFRLVCFLNGASPRYVPLPSILPLSSFPSIPPYSWLQMFSYSLRRVVLKFSRAEHHWDSTRVGNTWREKGSFLYRKRRKHRTCFVCGSVRFLCGKLRQAFSAVWYMICYTAKVGNDIDVFVFSPCKKGSVFSSLLLTHGTLPNVTYFRNISLNLFQLLLTVFAVSLACFLRFCENYKCCTVA